MRVLINGYELKTLDLWDDGRDVSVDFLQKQLLHHIQLVGQHTVGRAHIKLAAADFTNQFIYNPTHFTAPFLFLCHNITY